MRRLFFAAPVLAAEAGFSYHRGPMFKNLKMRLDRWNSLFSNPTRWAWLLAVVVVALNLSHLSTFYNFDGVACAMAIELGNFKYLLHGNHLLYGAAGWLFHSFLQTVGLSWRAIYSLQIMNILLGAWGVYLFFHYLDRRFHDLCLSLCGTLFMAFSFGYWFWSMEAQVYLLGWVPLLLCLMMLNELDGVERPFLTGCVWGMAVLGHVVHVMFFPVAVWFLWRQSGAFQRKPVPVIAKFTVGGFLVVAGAYALAGFLVIRPRTWGEVTAWLWGSAAMTADRSFAWHGQWAFSNVPVWFKTSLRTICFLPCDREAYRLPAFPILGRYMCSGILWLLITVCGIGFGFRGKIVWQRHRDLLIGCLLWLASYGIIFVSWEPHTVVYRLTDLIPVTLILLALSETLLKNGGKNIRLIWLAGITFLFLNNYFTAIRPLSDRRYNRELAQAQALQELVGEDGFVIVARQGTDLVYLPYFAARKALPLPKIWPSSPWVETIRSLSYGGSVVWVAATASSWEHWATDFPEFILNKVSYNGLTLYRLDRKNA